MLVSLTVGKVDAGVAVLLTEDKRHIEFPSILLPQTITSGSIVDITVQQNHKAEQRAEERFHSLQEKILNNYGLVAPTPPVLRLRNATQTSIVLEWDALQLATSTLKSLALYRNGSKAGNIPRPKEMLSTKLSGLPLDTEFSFYLVLRTSGGTYNSNTLTVRTHKMTNLTGITVTPGILPPQLRESLETAVRRIGAKLVETVRIDTTHFVCTEGRGKDWDRAVEMNIPVVRPEWIEGCEREGKIVGVRGYYLDANPKHRQVGSNPQFIAQPPGNPATSPAPPSGQTDLPHRPPRTPDPGAVEAGQDGGEPGPELPPTPPAKDKLPAVPTRNEDDSSDDEPEPVTARIVPEGRNSANVTPGREGSDEDDDEDDDEASTHGPGPTSTPGQADKRASVEDEREDAGGDMEEVAL